LDRERSVQLGLFARGSTMIDHGRLDGGLFVVIDPPRVADEDAFFDEPRRSRAWLLGAAIAVCALVGLGGFWITHTHARTVATSEVTLTEAPIPAPTTTIPPPPTVNVPVVAEPEHHAAPPPPVSPPAPKR